MSLADRLAELDVQLKELEIRQRQQELKRVKINWTVAGPVVITVLAGLIGFIQSNLTNKQNAGAQREIEEIKAKNELIIEAARTGQNDPSAANQNILFFIDAGLIKDPQDRIRNLIKQNRGPVLPSPSPNESLATCPIDATVATADSLIKFFEGVSLPAADIQNLREKIKSIVTKDITKKQEDALIVLLYNIGLSKLQNSEVIKLINADRASEAAEGILSLGLIGSPPLRGILIQRVCERDLFSAGI